MIEAEIHGIYSAAETEEDRYHAAGAVCLKASGEERYLTFGIGPFETLALALAKSGRETGYRRPDGHQLIYGVIRCLGGELVKVVLHAFLAETFYATLFVATDAAAIIAIDSRPSDALVLALRANAPIQIAPKVLEQAGQDSPLPVRNSRLADASLVYRPVAL